MIFLLLLNVCAAFINVQPLVGTNLLADPGESAIRAGLGNVGASLGAGFGHGITLGGGIAIAGIAVSSPFLAEIMFDHFGGRGLARYLIATLGLMLNFAGQVVLPDFLILASIFSLLIPRRVVPNALPENHTDEDN